MKKLLSLLFLLLPWILYASGGHGEGEFYSIIMVLVCFWVVLFLACSVLIRDLWFSFSFLFSVIWSTWCFYYGHLEALYPGGHDYTGVAMFEFFRIFIAFGLPIIYILIIILFRNRILFILDNNIKKILIFFYVVVPIIVFSLFILTNLVSSYLNNTNETAIKFNQALYAH